MERYKICVVTGTRAEYGLLKPVLQRLINESKARLKLVATGAHLSNEFGHTIDEILADGFVIDQQIECIEEQDGQLSMPLSVARAIQGFAIYFSDSRPDMVVVLGDRYEIFGVATAAVMQNIPIAHLYGGDTTEGAIDEFLRHSITKMSYLHFVSNRQSASRVIQLGEDPRRVFDVGSLGAENIKKMPLLSLMEFERSINFTLDKAFAVVTFHPVTLENGGAKEQFLELLKAVEQKSDMKFVFTKSNADAGGAIINKLIDEFVTEQSNCISFQSLGQLRYFSAIKYASMVIGNSSSGIYEVPLFGTPTINIGDRQKGRLQPNTVLNAEPKAADILQAMDKASRMIKRTDGFATSPYYKADTAQNIVNTIMDTLENETIDLKKKFYDLEQG